MPVLELTIIFADGVAGSNSIFSSTDKKPTLAEISLGAVTLTDVASRALADPATRSLIALDKRTAVVKSDSRKLKVM